MARMTGKAPKTTPKLPTERRVVSAPTSEDWAKMTPEEKTATASRIWESLTGRRAAED
ncbi:MAG: hypothetical protein P4L93_08225 [Coriobacteriia bacterium]|nr:hypothetical protein [Coriobacteriia bacterium]